MDSLVSFGVTKMVQDWNRDSDGVSGVAPFGLAFADFVGHGTVASCFWPSFGFDWFCMYLY